MDNGDNDGFDYLVCQPHAWRRQLYLKGRNSRAATVWLDMQANQQNLQEAAENWDLPLQAVAEIIRYCESHQDLLRFEADEERRRLKDEGVAVEPAPAA